MILVAGRKRLIGRRQTSDAADFVIVDAVADPTELQRAFGFEPAPIRASVQTYRGAGR